MPRTTSRLLGGRYRVESLLGEGAMSTVSRGNDELLQRTVAIKLLKPLYASDSEFVARFYNEACSAATAVAHVTEPAPSRRKLETFMSAPLAAIVDRLLQKDPEKRFASASELDAALALLDSSPVQTNAGLDSPTIMRAAPAQHFAARENPLERFWTWSRRLRREHYPYIAVGALIALLVLGAIASLAHTSTIAVSDVRHLQVAAAASHLSSAGFVPTTSTRTSQTAPAGTVIGQTPAAGTPLHAGDRVQLAVSSGPPLVAIPNLVGHTMLDAGIVLKRTKLRPTFAARINDAPANTVIEEIPAEGTRVRENSRALFVISTGPSPSIIYTGGGGD